MVVVPKKNGSPCRIVDLQILNAATYHETHYTPSPFYQTSSVSAGTLKQPWMHGMDITYYFYRLLQRNPPHSSPSGVNIGIARPLKASMSRGMPTLGPYWDVRYNLLCVGDAVVYDNRIVVPAALRSEVLDALHAIHQGVTGMKACAQTCIYWPGLSASIFQRQQWCSLCGQW